MEYISLYRKYATNLKKGSGNQWRGNCPFHNEKTPKNKSFSVNMETGQFHCHSCGKSGNATDIKKHFGERTNGYRNSSKIGGYNYDLKNVNIYHNNLLDNIENAPGSWYAKYIKLLKIGWNPSKNNFVFPIFDSKNEIINLKHHHGIQFTGASATLYPIHLLDTYVDSYIIIAEGEKDVISLLSNGLQAVTSTGGSKTIPNDITPLLRFKIIYICLDNDDAGERGTELWIKKLKTINPKSYTRVCDLSSYVGDGGDVTDYFSIEDKSQQTFVDEIIDRSIYARLPGTDVPSYIKRILLSDKMKELNFRDQIVFFHLVHRATRYTFMTSKINGMRVRMKPGEFKTSYQEFAELCGNKMTAKMVIRATDRLESLELIRKENLKMKRGMKFTVRNWIDENGHSESHSDLEKVGIQNIKFLPPEELIDKLNNGHSE